ncbi:DUF3060 domain-containing protein [Luteimonas sp. 3794]|uniref:DUF3060 domain-containing protein n=1 Tax=Luteimonas sp. 3794 TaxID=2817730 RepID=UPI00285A6646|nr:DUF3060 domain-containing protein [Luteimonas sp. 3794]MDR6991131.1 hypothetical protein [Luteimonas sp. 3794]
MRIALSAALFAACLLSACGNDPSPGEASTSASEAAARVLSTVTGGVLTDPASGANCNGQDVAITRDGFSLVLEGDCGTIVVTGSNGAVNVDRARAIRVDGREVTVLNMEVADVDVAGSNNILNLTEVGALRIAGDDNMVLARQIERVAISGRSNTVNPDNTPELDDTGSGNRVL